MTRREITAGCAWASRDAARAESLRGNRILARHGRRSHQGQRWETLSDSQRVRFAEMERRAELDRIQWEGQPTPWFAGIDTQPGTAPVVLMRGKAERASSEVVPFPFTEKTP